MTAILHVAQTADVRILFPLIVGPDDFARAIATVDRVADLLGFLRRPPIGAMLETPAALFALDEILELADFVAIGTNDLTQYMLAADRDVAEGTDDCTAMHPAVLRALRQIVEAAEQRQCPVCVCGEEAGDAGFASLLVGLGIRELSLTPTRAAAVRHRLRDITCVDARDPVDLALQCQEPQQVRELFQNLPTAEASVRWQNGQPSESSTVTPRGAPVATQLSGPATDRRQSLHDMNQSLKQRVAESTSRLSAANAPLTTARQDERLAAVAFETHDSIVVTDKDGKILRVNKSFTELTGYASEDVVGKSPRILKSERHGEDFFREMWQTIQTQGYWQGEIWNRRKDGHIYLQRLTIACVKNEFGEITHYVGDGQDLTLQKQGEADLAAIRAARKVQQTLFPLSAPCQPGFDIAGAVHPAERVSGDCFDYILLGQDSIGILVADVSGHELGPALLMAQTQAYLRALAETCADPGELLARANRLFATSDSGHFITMFLGRLDAVTRSSVYVGAGHQAYLIANDGAVRVLRSHRLGSTAQKQYQFVAILGALKAIPSLKVDPALPNDTTNGLAVFKIAEFHLGDRCGDFGSSLRGRRRKPFCKWHLPVRRFVPSGLCRRLTVTHTLLASSERTGLWLHFACVTLAIQVESTCPQRLPRMYYFCPPFSLT